MDHDSELNRHHSLHAQQQYEKYSFADDFTSGTSTFPQAVLSFLKANDGGDKANVAYVKLNYRF